MPTYNLKCTECNYEWTEMLSISEKENAKCPKCQAKAETNWGAKSGSMLIKGSGFYQERTIR